MLKPILSIMVEKLTRKDGDISIVARRGEYHKRKEKER